MGNGLMLTMLAAQASASEMPAWYQVLHDFGGWAVVIYVVWWLTREMKTAIAEQTKALLEQGNTIRQMVKENQEYHEEHTRKFDDLRRVLADRRASG